MTKLVRRAINAEGVFAGGPVGNNGLGSPLLQPAAQLGTVIGSVPAQHFGSFSLTDQILSRGAIVRFATSQQDGKKTAFSIRDCMDFRISPAARASNRLVLFPPFLAPAAERCALI